MKKLIRETECKGKEVENIIYSWENDKLIISFTDDTCLLLEVSTACDGEAIISPANSFTYSAFSTDGIINYNIITRAEFDEVSRTIKETARENRLRQYNKLKEEFELKEES